MKIKLSKSQWRLIGKKAGWIKSSQNNPIDLTNVHKSFPLSHSQMIEMKNDIVSLYPEADSISIVGTYSRVNEDPSVSKSHDVDVLIRIPEEVNEHDVRFRDDSVLWNKWSSVADLPEYGGTGKKPIIDFLLAFGKKDSGTGKHRERQEQGLATPEIVIWRKS